MRESSSLDSLMANQRHTRRRFRWLRIVSLSFGILLLGICCLGRKLSYTKHEHVRRYFHFDLAGVHINKALTYSGEGLFIEIGPEFWGYLGATLI